MKQISLKNIKRWIAVSNNNVSHPVSIHTACPGCLLSVVFSTRKRNYDPLRDTLACSAECPSCNIEVHFWMTNMTALADTVEDDVPGLFMMPSTESRMNLEHISHLLPDNVLQYCQSTRDVFESGNLTATRIMAQSTLDAIFSSFLPHGNSRSTLSKMVQDSLPSIDVNLPMTDLATALRKGQHLDRLLNSPEPVSRETADALMELVEKLVSFLYVQPTQFKELDQRLSELCQQLLPESERVSETVESDPIED